MDPHNFGELDPDQSSKWKAGFGSESKKKKLDPDPHQSEKLDQDQL